MRTMSRFIVWTALGLIGCLTLEVTPAGAADATLTIDQIIEGMRRLDAAFDPATKSYRVRFRQEQQTLDDQGEPDPTRYAWLETDYARQGKLAYAHIVQKIPSESQPIEEWVTWDDQICVHRRLDGIHLYPDVLPQCFNYYRYTDGLYADAYRLIQQKKPSKLQLGLSPSEAYVFALPRMVVENKSKYSVQPQLEDVDGDPCYVLEWPGRDKIWIDAKHGFVTRHRKIWFSPEVPADEMFNHDLFEARPGLWLSRRQVELRYHHLHSPPEKLGKVNRKDSLQLLEINFDSIPAKFFAVPVEPNEKLLVSDNVRKMQYWRHPEGGDPVAAALQDAQTLASPGRSRGHWMLVNGIVIGLLTAILSVKYLRRVRPAQ